MRGGIQGFKCSRQDQCLFVLPNNTDVELSAISLAPCLPVSSHASHHEDGGLKR